MIAGGTVLVDIENWPPYDPSLGGVYAE